MEKSTDSTSARKKGAKSVKAVAVSAKSRTAKAKSGKSVKPRVLDAKSGRLVTRGNKPPMGRVVDKIDVRVSASVLHRDTRPTLDLLQTSEAVVVTHYNEVEGFLVAPLAFASLVERVEEAEVRESELASTVTMLLAAARTGVPVPSDMLERVMPNVDGVEKWREIAEFAATFPVRFGAGEHGEPLTRASLSHVSGPIEESGTDDDLDLG